MSPSMSLIVTCAPSAENSSAVARPMPRAEPVMIAVLPSSSPISLLRVLSVIAGGAYRRKLRAPAPASDCRFDRRAPCAMLRQTNRRPQWTTTIPVQFSVDYPDRNLNRLTSAFRIFTVIPIGIVLAALSGGGYGWFSGENASSISLGGAGLLFAADSVDDPVPAQVPALVVRLEPRADALREPRLRLRPADGRPLPVHRRPPVRPPRLPLSGCRARAEPLAAAGEVAPGDPALHRPVLPLDRCGVCWC